MKAKQSTTKARKQSTNQTSCIDFLEESVVDVSNPCLPPRRMHTTAYHCPQLLADKTTTSALLGWFGSISEKRQMPWRKAFIDSKDFSNDPTTLQNALARRAYEVWVSEIMLQQTRVSTVISYFNNWISKWPTVEDLASATQDEVLAAWKGLGYYSRATRLHEAAQQIVKDMNGIMPADVENLLKIKGIGRYTAGAISSIVFGKPVPLLDGNVVRVLCRQVGLYAKVKEKKVDDLLWRVADVLVKGVAGEDGEVPGLWNQALMELGSTVCTPKLPKCEECPVQATCRAYAEGVVFMERKKAPKTITDVADIEDLCALCEILELEEVKDAVDEKSEEVQAEIDNTRSSRKRGATITTLANRPAKASKGRTDARSKQRSLRDFAYFQVPPKDAEVEDDTRLQPPQTNTSTTDLNLPSASDLTQIKAYCALFPKREPKKQVPEEQCVVCIIRHGNRYLIEQRPDKGLLASLWQFPTHTLPEQTESNLKWRRTEAEKYVQGIHANGSERFLSEYGPLMHVFSHLKLKMYVHRYDISGDDEDSSKTVKGRTPKRLWVDRKGVDEATLGTGMKKCWELVKEAEVAKR